MTRRLLSLAAFSVALPLIALTGCEAHGEKDCCAKEGEQKAIVLDKDAQAAITPDAALTRLMEGNARFVAGKSIERDLPAQVHATSHGQYPYAVVLSCIDSRTGPELVFDQGIGDIFSPRIAGNYANTDILGSMEFATTVAGAKLILVVGHSSCGAIKGACDNVELGNLTTVITALKPAAAGVVVEKGDRNSKNTKFVQDTAEANVRRTVASIRSNSPILAELEKTGKIKIVGAMQNLEDGKVSLLN